LIILTHRKFNSKHFFYCKIIVDFFAAFFADFFTAFLN